MIDKNECLTILNTLRVKSFVGQTLEGKTFTNVHGQHYVCRGLNFANVGIEKFSRYKLS